MRDLERWAEEQRSLARALGLSLEAWLCALEEAAERPTEVAAAVIGAGARAGLAAGELLRELDPRALAKEARRLVDPRPPRAQNPVLREAIRRADELAPGVGAARLKRPQAQPRTDDIPRPRRGDSTLGPSSPLPTADAPGTRERS